MYLFITTYTLYIVFSLVPRPLPVSNVACKKQEYLGREITCAALGTGQANERGQGYEKWTTKRSDIEKPSASVLRLYAIVAEIVDRSTADIFCDKLPLFGVSLLYCGLFESFPRRACYKSFAYHSEAASRYESYIPVCEEELLKSNDGYSRSTMIGSYNIPVPSLGRFTPPTNKVSCPHTIITLLPQFYLKYSARDVASQALPFFACNIKNWEWPGDEATLYYSFFVLQKMFVLKNSPKKVFLCSIELLRCAYMHNVHKLVWRCNVTQR